MEDFKTAIQAWGNTLKSTVINIAPALNRLKVTVKLKYGIPERVRITFPRHYVFREKGVGKGRKIGSGKETPKPAINPAIEQHIDKLADIAAEHTADIAATRLFIK